jgi:hypothetical protein
MLRCRESLGALATPVSLEVDALRVESRRLSTGQIPLAVRTLIKIEELSKYRGALWRVAVEL